MNNKKRNNNIADFAEHLGLIVFEI